MKDEELICTSFSDPFSASKVSTALKIKIKYKPRIFLEVSKDIIIEGDKVEVTCKANAYPVNIVYRWFIDNDEIIGENRNVLKIENIQKESDKMKVKCIAANNVGSSEKMNVLILIRQPESVSQRHHLADLVKKSPSLAKLRVALLPAISGLKAILMS